MSERKRPGFSDCVACGKRCRSVISRCFTCAERLRRGDDPVELTGGRWILVRGIQRWQPDPPKAPTRAQRLAAERYSRRGHAWFTTTPNLPTPTPTTARARLEAALTEAQDFETRWNAGRPEREDNAA